MSISQLLSNSTAPYAPPSTSITSSIPSAATTSSSDPSFTTSDGQPYFESISALPPPTSSPSTASNNIASSSKNGIENLLNVTTDEHRIDVTADSDTDSEDIALINGKLQVAKGKNCALLLWIVVSWPLLSSHLWSSIGNVSPSNPYIYTSKDQQQQQPQQQQQQQITVQEAVSDSSSGDDDLSDGTHSRRDWKPIRYKHHEQTLQLLDDEPGDDDDEDDDDEIDSDDNELLEIHKHAMVEYMLNVHRRKKLAIDAYESKRTVNRYKKKKGVGFEGWSNSLVLFFLSAGKRKWRIISNGSMRNDMAVIDGNSGVGWKSRRLCYKRSNWRRIAWRVDATMALAVSWKGLTKKCHITVFPTTTTTLARLLIEMMRVAWTFWILPRQRRFRNEKWRRKESGFGWILLVPTSQE